MDKRILGRTGMEVSPIAIGGAAFTYVQESRGWNPMSDEGRKVVIATLNAALDQGINYIDTAPAYGDGYSETLVGGSAQGPARLASTRSHSGTGSIDAGTWRRSEAVCRLERDRRFSW
jgi:aryl-alcohol dehydrogenase-like predicted oxidoreductase